MIPSQLIYKLLNLTFPASHNPIVFWKNALRSSPSALKSCKGAKMKSAARISATVRLLQGQAPTHVVSLQKKNEKLPIWSSSWMWREPSGYPIYRFKKLSNSLSTTRDEKVPTSSSSGSECTGSSPHSLVAQLSSREANAVVPRLRLQVHQEDNGLSELGTALSNEVVSEASHKSPK